VSGKIAIFGLKAEVPAGRLSHASRTRTPVW